MQGCSQHTALAKQDMPCTFLTQHELNINVIIIMCMQCPKTRWRSCPACQQCIREQDLEDEYELQSWFIRRMNRFLAAQGKQLIGWDEILEGGLAEGACVMSWRVRPPFHDTVIWQRIGQIQLNDEFQGLLMLYVLETLSGKSIQMLLSHVAACFAYVSC